jgi:YbgC/YbaW family acyl-CoA thioester hydrolase
MPCEYRFRRRVNFYETDAAGLVHFSCYFRYMEEAEHALWREAGLSIHPPGAEIGFPRVSTSFEYHSALRFEQEFDVHLRVTAMTKKSIRYTCVLSDGNTKIATGTLVTVCVRRRANGAMAATEIPSEIAAHIQVAPDCLASSNALQSPAPALERSRDAETHEVVEDSAAPSGDTRAPDR